MTDPTPRDERPPRDDGPVIGDHPEMENDEGRREQPARRGDRLSAMMVAGFVALIILVVVIILWAI